MKKNQKKTLSKITLISNIAIFIVVLLVFNICFGLGVQETSGKGYGAFYNGNKNKNNACFMINVYWGTEYLPDILKVLEENNIQTTFFVGGYWVEKNTDLLKKMIDMGHEIGNHGYFHKNQDKLSVVQNIEEIKNCNDLVKKTTGYEMTLFAPPSGAMNENVLEAAGKLSMKTIMWTKDTIDWRDHNINLIKERAIKNIQNGDFILAHPTEHTLNALQGIINAYKNAGINFTTISNCL